MLTLRYNLEFRKITFFGLIRYQSIRKSKQISGQKILSGPRGLKFNPNFAKIAAFYAYVIAWHGSSRHFCQIASMRLK